MIEQVIEFFQDQLQNNDLFKGGLLLMGGGAVLAIVRGWPGRIWSFIKRQSMVEIDVPDKDQAFHWLNLWLSEHNYSKKRSRLLTVKTEREDRDLHKPKIIFSPAPGTHYMFWKRRLMILSRNRQDQAGGDSSGGSADPSKDPFREYFTIRILGRRRDIALSLINEAYKMANPETNNQVTIHRAMHYGDWTVSSKAPQRPIESVILPKGFTEDLIDDIQEFLNSDDWYTERGIPYRRGYLFYGPPGNGKTSAVLALATHFNLDIGILSLKMAGLEDDDLYSLLTNTPKNTLVLLEDIDCVVDGRNTDGAVTFSGLLNALDGLSSAHKQIIFMTTNHRDKLDPALVRPGRCDMQKEFKNADTSQKVRMFERFFPDSNLALEFSEAAVGDFSMATLQQHMMQYRNSAEQALEHATNLGKDTE